MAQENSSRGARLTWRKARRGPGAMLGDMESNTVSRPGMAGAITPAPARRARRARGVLCASMALLAACTVDLRNAEPARQLARESQPAGSVYVGWRVYQSRCATCHGVDAAGPAKVPGLLDEVRQMGTRRFVNLVLYRYDWSAVGTADGDDEATRRSLVEDILRRREQAFAMPAWQDEPPVSAHVLDLYAYLSARADGVQGPGRPRP
jgi:mono/diheme cytochrome c family protein